jgi:hypothetical protein
MANDHQITLPGTRAEVRTDGLSNPPDTRERKLVGDNSTPARGSKPYRHVRPIKKLLN